MAFGRSVVRFHPDTEDIYSDATTTPRGVRGDAGDAWNRVLSSVGNRGDDGARCGR